MLQEKTIQVGDNSIIIRQLGTTLALYHSIKLGALFGGLTQGIESRGGNVQDWNIDFGKMVEGILAALDPNESPIWIKKLLKESMIKPEFNDIWFDKTFSGSLEDLLDFLKDILEHNYGGLLEYTRKKIIATTTDSKSSGPKKTSGKR